MAEPGTQQSTVAARPTRLAAKPGAGPAASGLMTIGELAAAAGVTVRTLRFYQSKGLLAQACDDKARVFGLTDRNRLELILQGKRLGFGLRDIREILASHDRCNGADFPVNRKRSAAQIEFIERQRQDLGRTICELRQIYSCLFRDLLAPGRSAARR